MIIRRIEGIKRRTEGQNGKDVDASILFVDKQSKQQKCHPKVSLRSICETTSSVVA